MSEYIRSKEHSQDNYEITPESDIEKNKEVLAQEKKEALHESQEKAKQSREKIQELEQESHEEISEKFNNQDKLKHGIVHVDKSTKQHAKDEYLGAIRHRLNKTEKRFSKFIHNPQINITSEALGKTLIRPSGILTGAIFTLVGSIYYLYISHATGFQYNFYVATLLFVGGFVSGVVIEFIIKLVFTKD